MTITHPHPAHQKPPPVVFVLEDEPLIRDALACALSDAGCCVREGQNANTAIKAFEKGEHIDVVVTDVNMPGRKDGVALAAWMKDHAPGVPIILISGYPLRSDLAAVNPAIAIVVKKPYTPDEVVGWVASLANLEISRVA